MSNKADAIFKLDYQNGSVSLFSPTSMPKAAGFLWNQHMMLQMNCRGFAVAHHMQPEPAKYSRGPSLEAATFMQPEHHYYACHPGRFFYVKDESDNLFSLPYEPVRKAATSFEFCHSENTIDWHISWSDLRFELCLELLEQEAAELWSLKITNLSDKARHIQLTPYFSIGFMSWMNQSATFDPELNGIVASSVTPYQKTEDYPKQAHFKDMTYLLSDCAPDSWLASQSAFEGEGGLADPDALKQQKLSQQDAHYAQPAAVLQYAVPLAGGASKPVRWLFGPARDKQEIQRLKLIFSQTQTAPKTNSLSDNCLQILDCPDKDFAHFVNHWLPRQVRYHAESNRLTTDPQTRNFLQDSMGRIFIDASKAREAFVLALSQQAVSGLMPDGILLHPDASLKYINQVPHSDHNLWLTLFLSAYLRETNDVGILEESCAFAESDQQASVFEHMQLAMQALQNNLDQRNLSLIHQGDWCDPMNMVGYKGKGVSAWLSMATAYVFRLWADICQDFDQQAISQHWLSQAELLCADINQHFWTGDWYARGITDEGRLFGCPQDEEGRIFLNAQSWALLCNAPTPEQTVKLLAQVDAQLHTPFGNMLLAPAYTRMQEDIGRLTQKFPGSAENGSVYNHACAYYAFSLYHIGHADKAFSVLKRMLVSAQDAEIRGQLPVYVPNYYRGAYYQYPDSAGLSSQLFNTGTVAWYYLCVIEELFGLKGDKDALIVQPQLPSDWQSARVSRQFRGASIEVEYERRADASAIQLSVDGQRLASNRISGMRKGDSYQIKVILPPSPAKQERA